MVQQGGCFCGNLRISFSEEPAAVALCHCTDCRKVSGSVFTYNILVKEDDLKIEGEAKPVPKIADSGNEVTNYFCPNCGTTVYGQSPKAYAGVYVVKAGALDDASWINSHPPQLEIFESSRIEWVPALESFQKQ